MDQGTATIVGGAHVPNPVVDVAYLMEARTEHVRLRSKFNREKTYDQLVLTGILDLPEMPHIVDAGCGEGSVAALILEMQHWQYNGGSLTCLDSSADRLALARQRLDSTRVLVETKQCDLAKIPMPSNSADYVFCRFVFEYLQHPAEALRELLRIAKPSSKVVVGDLDCNCLLHYPLSKSLETRMNRIAEVLQQQLCFDPFVGRKLYSMFRHAGCREIKVHMVPHHLIYGKMGASDQQNLLAKLEQLSRLQREKRLTIDFSVEEFKDEFLRFMMLEDRFSYTPLILVEGIKP